MSEAANKAAAMIVERYGVETLLELVGEGEFYNLKKMYGFLRDPRPDTANGSDVYDVEYQDTLDELHSEFWSHSSASC